MPKTKKEPLSIIIVKTILAVIFFAGLGTIIIGGGYIIANYGKRCEPVLNSDRKIVINEEYKTCQSDNDCVHIMTECSCDCGQAVNRKYKDKYEKLRDLKCKFYSGKLCKMFCGGTPKCVNNVCQLVDENEDVSMTTNKTEYQAGEEVELTVRNNLDEKIEFYNIAVEKFNNNNWKEERFDIECLGLCERTQTMINSKSDKSFLWDQKDNIGLQIGNGKFRFRIGVWDNAFVGNGLPPMFNYYSDEFTIKSDLFNTKELNNCQEDSDCEVYFSSCNCQYHCINKDAKVEECDCICNETGPIISECVCENNKCIEIEFGEIDDNVLEKKNLTNDDWDWDSGQNCHGLNEVEQCGYLDWPISYGCRIASVNNCYECLAEKNKDATICENIKSGHPARKDNCYWRLAISLSKAGINDEIDFCDKFSGEWKESYKRECLKLAK